MAYYDVLVIGGGTAGSNAARTAHNMGAHTALVHKPDFLNLCIERGCMPSKSLLAAAELHGKLRRLPEFGIELTGHANVNLGTILARKDHHIDRFLTGLYETINSDGYDVYLGEASFLPEEQGVVIKQEGEEHVISADRYVLATGTAPFIPPIDGLDEVPYYTSDDIMQNKLTELPESMIVIGGGAIGLEFATFFADLGTHVTIVDRHPLLWHEDPEFGEELMKSLTDRGIMVRAPVSLNRVEAHGDRIAAFTGEHGERLVGQRLLVAAGRRPQLDALALENIGLSVEHGAIVSCDAAMCAGNERIFAAGDLTRELQLLHVAAAEGKVAGANAAGAEPKETVDYDALNMMIIFTHPPYAHVGMTERQARERRIPLVTHTINFPHTGRAIVMGERFGLWKLLVHKETGEILGSSILGPRADDLIHEVHLARRLRADIRTLAQSFAYHPTLSEQFISLVQSCAKQLDADA